MRCSHFCFVLLLLTHLVAAQCNNTHLLLASALVEIKVSELQLRILVVNQKMSS